METKYKYTQKEKNFCNEYILNWNATQSYLKAYPNTKNENVAGSSAARMLLKPKIQSYIENIQKDLEKIAGISRLSVVLEFKKIAFSSIAHLHNTWVELHDFNNLTDDQKSCIESVDTKVVKRKTEEGLEIDVEQVKIKLYDKQKALENINKMLGYNEPDELVVDNRSVIILPSNDRD